MIPYSSLVPIILLSFAMGMYYAQWFLSKGNKKKMDILTWTNLIAVLAFIQLYRSIKSKNGLSISILLAVLVLVFTAVKGCQDGRATAVSVRKQDSIKAFLDTIGAKALKIDVLSVKVDTLNSYVKKVEALGLKRDSIHNIPVPVNQTFNTQIGSVKSKDFTIGAKN
jgi:hypothetical protein